VVGKKKEEDEVIEIPDVVVTKATKLEEEPIHIKTEIHGLPSEKIEDSTKTFSDYVLIILSVILLIIFFPFAPCFTTKIVAQYSRAVLLRLGRLHGGALGPGVFCIIPCTDSYRTIDLRVKTFDVPSQEVLTRDSVTVHVNAVVYYRISDPVKSVLNVEDVNLSTQLLGQTTLRNVIGTHLLQDLIAKREAISHTMQIYLDEATDPWGVKVDRVEIKDIVLPSNMQRAMAAEAEATREARAKVVAAGGERLAARNLRLAADEMMKSPSALQLRYLQTLTQIASERNSTIIFPFPIDMLGPGSQHNNANNNANVSNLISAGLNMFSNQQQQQRMQQEKKEEDEEEEEVGSDIEHLRQPLGSSESSTDPSSNTTASTKAKATDANDNKR